MENIFIFGHKKPDTDSVTASIALSYLKKTLGQNTVPMVLGDINNETKFVLDYFEIEQPKYLNDVKLQIKDLVYKKGYYMKANESIYKGYLYMNEHSISTLPIINNKNKFEGIVSMKDIAKDQISGDLYKLNTSYQNIMETLDGIDLLKYNEEITGNILVASFKSTTFIENVSINSSTILIVGDRHSIIEYAVHNGAKLIILTGDRCIKDDHLEIARKNKVNIIKTPYDTFKVSKIINLCNYISSITVNNNILCFDETEDVNDFIEIANKTKFSNYPIINKDSECLGFLRLSDIADKRRKKVILVDHNEYEQSVDGLEEAEIIEIIDHHKIGSIGTTLPINFRNMPVGSTNTIIYLLYKENNVSIPKNIGGIMLSGIISDTLLLSSPTTTQLDKDVVEDLSKISGTHYYEYGVKMFGAGSSLKGKTKEEILYSDFKNFTIDNKKIGIGQIFTMNITEIQKDINEYIQLIENIGINNDYYIIALFVTDIINNGSCIIFNNSAKDILDNCFGIIDLKQGQYIPGCVSRKKQIIPNIMIAMEKK